MKPLIYFIFISLMLAGNCFGVYQLFTGKQEFLSKYPALSDKNYIFLQIVPIANIIGLTGMLFFKSWAPYLAIVCAVAVIFADIYFGIHYHLYLAIPSALILLFFIVRYWNHFK